MTKNDTKRLVRSLRVLRLEPGDVLLVTLPRPVPDAAKDAIHDCIRQTLPGQKCLVVDHGIEVAAIRGAP